MSMMPFIIMNNQKSKTHSNSSNSNCRCRNYEVPLHWTDIVNRIVFALFVVAAVVIIINMACADVEVVETTAVTVVELIEPSETSQNQFFVKLSDGSTHRINSQVHSSLTVGDVVDLSKLVRKTIVKDFYGWAINGEQTLLS